MLKMWRNWNSHTLLVRMKNGTTTVENSLAVFYSYVPVSPHLSIYVREMNTHVHTDLYTNVKSTCICNSQNLKIIQMSINR